MLNKLSSLVKREKKPTEQEILERIRVKAAAYNAENHQTLFGTVREQAPGLEVFDGEPSAIEMNRCLEEIVTRTWRTVHFNEALTQIMFGSYDIGKCKVGKLTIEMIRELDFLRDLHNGVTQKNMSKWENNDWYNGRMTFRDESLRKYIR